MRIAFFSPLRPVPSGISDYSEEILPHLSQEAEITLFVDDYEPSNPVIRRLFPVYGYRDFEALHRDRPFDLNLYQVGNHPCHAYIYEMLLCYPGLVVLHDAVLHDLMRYMLAVRGNLTAYMDAFPQGEGLSLLRRLRAGAWSELDHVLFPGLCRLVRQSSGIIVHSQAARRRVLQVAPEARVHVVPQHIGPDRSPFRGQPGADVKRKFDLPPESLIVGTFGYVTSTKRLRSALLAYQEFLQSNPATHYLVVGGDESSFDTPRLVRELGLEGLVRVTGYVPFEQFYGLLDATDICIQLRYPSNGEMSAAILRVMSKGKPVLLSNLEQFAEFPDDCCLKVDLGPAEVPMIVAYLRLLAGDEALRRRIGENVRRYVSTNNSVERAVQGYWQAVRGTVGVGRAGSGGLDERD